MIRPIGHFRLYVAKSNEPGRYRHVGVRPQARLWRWLLRGLDWLLDRWGWHVCHHESTDEVRYQEFVVNAGTILWYIREQLQWADRAGYHPTKVILGPRQLEMIEKNQRAYVAFQAITIPNGVPMLEGLELVVNPCIDGVVIG